MESIIDLQARLMNNNPVFFRIPEQQEKDPEGSIKRFLVKQLKPLAETVKNISFYWVHCLDRRRLDDWQSRPIVTKFSNRKNL